jgi:Tfp pilus assembly protein PilO
VVPTVFIASGFFVVNFIKPDYNLYQQKKAERNSLSEQVQNAENTIRNAEILVQELGNNREKVAFINAYFPQAKDEAQVIDGLNFLSTQAGMITSNISLQGEAESTQSTQVTTGAAVFALETPAVAPAPTATGSTPSALLAISVGAPVSRYTPPVAQKYGVTLEAVGSYSNIKEIIKKIANTDRQYLLSGFTIASTKNGPTSGTEENQTSSSGTLTLSYAADLPYFIPKKATAGYGIVDIPALQKNSLSLDIVEKQQRNVDSAVPDTLLTTDGKQNPFE